MDGGESVFVGKLCHAARMHGRTSRGETTAGGQPREVRRLAGDRDQLAPLQAAMDRRMHQALRIRMRWLLQHLPHRPILHDPSRIHHRDLVRDLVSAGKRIVRVVPDRQSLEDVYLSLVGADS